MEIYLSICCLAAAVFCIEKKVSLILNLFKNGFSIYIFASLSLLKTLKKSNILRFIILRHVQLLCNLFPSSLLDNFCCVCLVCNLKCFQYSCFSCIWEESSFAFSKMFLQSIAVSTDSWEKMDGWRCCCYLAGFALHFAATLLKHFSDDHHRLILNFSYEVESC